ncbi:MAG: right-handed parallel beta-helix repeat-containing protein [Segetibacter sp.]|nr:right-handed parallel beta-helix repeat-containing protein [Segetibacter sp.]
MKKCTHIIMVLAVMALLTSISPSHSFAQKFIHPGVDQTSKDLEYMKKMVLTGEEPYKSAFKRLKAASDTTFIVRSHTHVLRGPYGRPNIGGDDLSKSANMAYNYALVWYITNDKKYADKAIEILNAWSPVLWDFDYNDAKLLAAWTGHMLCNAAEILRYTNSGWQAKDIGIFTNMLMTVYYPLMRYYYPQANGNWDGAIIHSIMAIAIFTDNRKMFNNAVDHFLHAPFNGSLFKYIYPNGQCQETMRDQAHVQLGLGEFAGAAQIAFTQGVDLFSIANNRIALGYEYTAGFLLGSKPHSYGIISERAKDLRDDYENVYRHYTSHGVDMPYTKRAADSVRPKAGRSILTSVRVRVAGAKAITEIAKASTIGYIAGAGAAPPAKASANAIVVEPGQSIQNALNAAAKTGGWVVVKSGVHTLPTTLKLPSGVTLSGDGLASILFLDPASEAREAIVNANDDLHDVTIRDLVIECATRTEVPSDPNSTRSYRGGYNRGGILFRTKKEGQIKNINLINLTVQNGTYNGVFINGASNLTFLRCNFNENGVSVAPGQKLMHNLLLTHCRGVNIKDSRLATSPLGSGIALDHCRDVSITNNEVARNGYYGILISESKNVAVKGNLIEANDRSGVMAEFLHAGSENVTISNNLIHYNTGFAVECYGGKNNKVENNTYAGNGNNINQQKVSNEKIIIME